MTVETTNAIDGPYYPNGVTTSFSFTFTAPTADEVAVVQVASDGTESTVSAALYSVTLNAVSGGTVTFASAPAAGPTLFVTLAPDFKQEINFTNRPRFADLAHNESLDRAAARDQALRRDVDRAVRVPTGEAGLLLPPAADRAGKIAAFDAGGAVVPASGTGADSALRTDLADETSGTALIKHNAGTGSLFRTTKLVLNDAVRLADFAAYTGTNADAAWAAAWAEAQSRGLKKIVGKGGHNLLTNAILPAGFTFEGDGDSTRLTVGANNANVLNIASSDVTIKGVKLEGNGTSSASTNGLCVYVTGEGLVMEDVLFSGAGFAGIAGTTTTAKRGPKLIRTRHRLTEGGTSHCEVFLGGAWQNIMLIEPDFVASSTSVERGLLLYNVNDAVWNMAQVVRPWCEGYGRQGIACTDENWTGGDRVFGFFVKGGYFKNNAMAAIKCKLSKGISVSDVIVDSCGGTPENGPSGLYGAILLNSIGAMNVSNARIRDSGTAAIVFNGNDASKSRPDGFGLATIKTSKNFIEGTGTDATNGAGYGNGIVALGRIKEISCEGDSLRSIKRYGVMLDGAVRNGIQSANLRGVTVIDSPAASHYAIYVKNTGIVQQDGCRVHNWSLIPCWYENVENVRIGASDSAGDSATASACYYFGPGVQNVEFSGRASCSFYDAHANATAYVEGQRVQTGGNVYQCVTPGTSGTGTPPTGADGGVLLTDGTAQWRFVHYYRKNNSGLLFSPGAGLVTIGGSATFDYLVGPAIAGNPPSNLKRNQIASGTATLSGGTVTVTLPSTEFDANYKIALSHSANETIRVSSKTTTQATFTSSNGSSTSSVDWLAYR